MGDAADDAYESIMFWQALQKAHDEGRCEGLDGGCSYCWQEEEEDGAFGEVK